MDDSSGRAMRRGAIADSSTLGNKSSATKQAQSGKSGDTVRKRTSASGPKVKDAGDSAHHEDDGEDHTVASGRAPTKKSLLARQDAQPTSKLIQSVTSKWSRYTEAMVVKLIEGGEDVHSKLLEPWDGAFVEYGQTVGATALHFACRRGLLEVIRSLIEHAAPVNGCTDSGATPIMVASMFSQAEAARLLFEAKASVLAKDDHGFCAMDLAILEGSREVIAAVQDMEVEEEHNRELAVMVDNDEGSHTPDGSESIDSDESLSGEASFGHPHSSLRELTSRKTWNVDEGASKEWKTEEVDGSGTATPQALSRNTRTSSILGSRTSHLLRSTSSRSSVNAGSQSPTTMAGSFRGSQGGPDVNFEPANVSRTSSARSSVNAAELPVGFGMPDVPETP